MRGTPFHLLTSDGVRLDGIDTGGDGVPLLLLHGWGQTQELFRHQVALLAPRRVITYDMRGHGLSEKPDHGYRIARLAADLRDVLEARSVAQADVVGWSMGASVLWSYLQLFGASRLRALVLLDQPAAVVALPWASPAEHRATGAILPVDGLTGLADAIRTDASGEVVQDFVRGMFSEPLDPAAWALVSEQIRILPVHAALPLLVDHGMQDWRDVLPRITVPTLVVGCEGSHVAPESQRYIADRIPGARLHVFPHAEAHSHFPFLENPAAFNAVVEEFLDTVEVATHVEERADTLSESGRAPRA